MIVRSTRKTVWACLAAMLLTALPAAAQITTGNVLGTVKDSTGGVVPGATVVLISEARGTKSVPAVTNETGDYVFPNVTADTYTVEVTMDMKSIDFGHQGLNDHAQTPDLFDTAKYPTATYTGKLVKMAGVGMLHSREYVREKMACIRKREDKAAPYLQRSK